MADQRLFGEWIREAEVRLNREGARTEAQVLLAHSLGLRRSQILHRMTDVGVPEVADELLARRLKDEPLAYILGYREFYGREFIVRPGVLIPRHETELLIEETLALDLPPDARILDFGTGSGCIAITLKLERPSWQVTAIDISEEALAVARQNGDQLNAPIEWLESDGFANLEGRKFDCIVSNPPYIADSESLETQVRDFEPIGALFSGPTGLEMYERIAREAHDFAPKVVLEIGYEQGESVPKVLRDHGWSVDPVRLDLSGQPRCVIASLRD